MLTGAVALISDYSNMPLGNNNFWDYRGYFGGIVFLFFISLFPRLTLFISSVPFGGLLWWIGFFFMPRLLVASLATINYWNSNKILVVISWLVALGGESSEKILISRRPKFRFFYRSNNKPNRPIRPTNQDNAPSSSSSSSISNSSNSSANPDVIETEFKRL